MDLISLKNFRCFHDEQEARLAPLTLLVGDNSTGKTSLMAMIRVLCEVAYSDRIPNFKEEPYDLGGFDDIVHYRGPRGGRTDSFKAGFETKPNHSRGSSFRFSVVFKRGEGGPIPVRRHLLRNGIWFEENQEKKEFLEFRIGTSRGSWKFALPARYASSSSNLSVMWPFGFALRYYRYRDDNGLRCTPLKGSPEFTEQDLNEARKVVAGSVSSVYRPHFLRVPYASAPVRSKPRRTYDPAQVVSDPQGDYVPMYLANMYIRDKDRWLSLKNALEGFGRASGLFDEIDIKQLGKRENEPFQLQIRKFSGRLKGPPRNMIDVGYGISQVLPVITELLRPDAPSMFLLQQPEVHLHPSAQAALGSFFCEIAQPNRQIFVETHSDHLLDRVRTDVRDGKGKLKPDDVSILYFERNKLDVRIHSLMLDQEGNVLNAPQGYRRFFLEETKRSLGL